MNGIHIDKMSIQTSFWGVSQILFHLKRKVKRMSDHKEKRFDEDEEE